MQGILIVAIRLCIIATFICILNWLPRDGLSSSDIVKLACVCLAAFYKVHPNR